MNILNNYNDICNNINSIKRINLIKDAKIIIVTKTVPIERIQPLINAHHIHFGENKFQEAKSKWLMTKKNYPNIKLHFLGKLQSNKVDDTYDFFDFIHSVDSKKVALKIYENEKKFKKNIPLFVQVNIGREDQKGGLVIEDTKDFVEFCKKDLKLNIIGLMCIPPFKENPNKYFQNLKDLASKCNLSELSMGMSSDYKSAIEQGATFIRVGAAIFGERVSQ
jgi:pyridoxal phosphate enzyme (YggS family)